MILYSVIKNLLQIDPSSSSWILKKTPTPVWAEPCHIHVHYWHSSSVFTVALVDCLDSIIFVYLKHKHLPIIIYCTKITVTLLTRLMFSVCRFPLVISSFSCLHIQKGNILRLLSCLSSETHVIHLYHLYCTSLLLFYVLAQ